MILQPGQTIDRFVVERSLGEGGMAAVYQVRHTTLDAVYALKILAIPSAAVRERMLREGRFQATLRHSNIVSVLDVLDIHGVLGLLMEYVDGPSLEEWLAVYRPTLRESMAVFGGILSAMDMVHSRGIIHRDLKPANVLLHITDQGVYPRVTDFGIAKSKQLSDVTTGSGATVGTPAYMAPEQFRDASTVDQRADIFSLGAILYELVCGRRAFAADNLLALMNSMARGEYTPPEQVVADLPESVRSALLGALRAEPSHRLADCRRLAAVLTGQSAVHNIADAMPRRLEPGGPGVRAAVELRDRLRPRPPEPTPAPAPRHVPLPREVTYDEPIAAYSESSVVPASRRDVRPQPSVTSVVVISLLLLCAGLLTAILVVVASSSKPPELPVQVAPDSQDEVVDEVPEEQAAPAPRRRRSPKKQASAEAVAAGQLDPNSPEPVAVLLRSSGSAATSLLRNGKRFRLPATVPPGDYGIEADFGTGPAEVGAVTVRAGAPMIIVCDARAGTCGTSR